ncbi:MAG: RNA polymerase sigma factor [Lentisphaeria bacterium]|nr:RNA polymerase sigma factor [Lentisphaeria bacterium]
MTKHITDLILDIRQGNIDRFEELIDLHKDQVLRIVQKRIDYQAIEEVCQDCFIKIYNSLEKFSGKSPFENWITRISIRTCCDYWRKSYRNKEVYASAQLDEDIQTLELLMNDSAKEKYNKEQSLKNTKEELTLALSKLKPKDRTVLELVYFLGWSTKEVAEAEGKSLTATKVRLMRARKKLRIQMEIVEGAQNEKK